MIAWAKEKKKKKMRDVEMTKRTPEKSIPTERDILALVGKKAKLWEMLRDYLAANYDHVPELSIGKDGHDLTFRYRKGGKTLVTLEPEKGGFKVLVVLGREEDAKARDVDLSPNVKGIYENAKQFHDGRWLWIRPKTKAELESIKKILAIKRKPKAETP